MIATSLVLFVLFKNFNWCILFHLLFKCTLDPNAMNFEQDVNSVTFDNIEISNLEATHQVRYMKNVLISLPL
jgi:hypothetical protein